MSIYDYDVEFVRGVNNEMTDWLSRSTNKIDHVEAPWKEEFVINEVKTRLDEDAPEYGEELGDLMKVIAVDDWPEYNKMKFKEYWKYLSDIAENDEMLFFKKDRFIPEKRLMTKILMKAHGIHVGMTRMISRIKETFWWPGW